MDKNRTNGFVLVLVIMALMLVSVIMFVLSSGSSTMMFQTNTAYLTACQRNLTASGLAWARGNAKGQEADAPEQPVTLDVNDLGIRVASLTVALNSSEDQRPQVRIATSVSRSARTLSNEVVYDVALR